MKLAGWAILFRLPIYAIVAITAIAGIASFSRLPQAVYPNLNISRIEIRAESADLSPTLVQASLTRPIERELQSLPGIVQMKALSTQGAADISVSFDPHVLTSAQALQRASGAVDAIRSTRPGDAAVRVAAPARRHDRPEDRVVGMTADVVPHHRPNVLGHLVDAPQDVLDRVTGPLWVLLERGVSVVHVSRVVLVVVDLHGHRVDVRLERVVCIWKWRELKSHFRDPLS